MRKPIFNKFMRVTTLGNILRLGREGKGRGGMDRRGRLHLTSLVRQMKVSISRVPGNVSRMIFLAHTNFDHVVCRNSPTWNPTGGFAAIGAITPTALLAAAAFSCGRGGGGDPLMLQ